MSERNFNYCSVDEEEMDVSETRYVIVEKQLYKITSGDLDDVVDLEGDTQAELLAYASSKLGIPESVIEFENSDDDEIYELEEEDSYFYLSQIDEEDFSDKYIILPEEKTLVNACNGDTYTLQGDIIEELVENACEEACIQESQIIIDDIGQIDLDNIGENGIFNEPLTEDEISFCENLNDK